VNLIPDKVGGSKKQIITLSVLGVVLVAVYFLEREPSSGPAPVQPATTATPATQTKIPAIARERAVVPDTSGPKLATRSGNRSDDFRPTLKLPEGVDVTKIDPTLRLDLLAKLQQVPLEGGSRSVFDYGQAPVPPPPPVAKIQPNAIALANAKEAAAKFAEQQKTMKPPPAPIPLKFYGFAKRAGGPAREAFFLDGDDIRIEGENDVIRGRYKVIRIGINSATVEDLQTHDQQVLPLVAELNS